MSQRLDPEAAFREAAALQQQGDAEAAVARCRKILARHPRHAASLNLLGVVAAQAGDVADAIDLFGQAVSHDPTSPDFLTNLGLAYMEAGQGDRAGEPLGRATELPGATALSFFALGNLTRDQGRARDAIELYRRTVAMDPRMAEAHNNIGCLLFEEGDSEAAEVAFRDALAENTEHADALGNLGAALAQRGAPEAVEILRKALKVNPGGASLLHNLGLALQKTGQGAEALEVLWQAVQADPDDPTGWTKFTDAFGQADYSTVEDVGALLEILRACFLRPGIDYQKLGRATGKLLASHPPMQWLLDRVPDPVGDAGGAGDIGEAVRDGTALPFLNDPLIQMVLGRIVIPNARVERLWTDVRRTLLEIVSQAPAETADKTNAETGEDAPPVFAGPELVYTLARQCFLNGYVFSYDDEEVRLVEALAADLAGCDLPGSAANQVRVGVLACYVSLHTWDQVPAVLELAQAHPNSAFVELLVQQVEEPLEEFQLTADIPSLGEARGEVSREVQAQYEEHPYPRWTSVDRRRPQPLKQVVQALFPDLPSAALAECTSPRILIAGCGTGKHIAMVHNRFANAEIVAIDLSLTSLAYALRKMRELQIDGTTLFQADILALDGWDERFDLVESSGVLHHMEDPQEGWRILTGLVKPGGLMKIALYSEIARQDVVEARRRVAAQGHEATEDGIRAFRRAVFSQPEDDAVSGVVRWRDFFLMEECRDLLFHVHEHRFTLLQIKDMLVELDLELLGLEMPTAGLWDFRRRFPEEGAQRDLEKWHVYEQENPDVFRAMYHFWVRKPGGSSKIAMDGVGSGV